MILTWEFPGIKLVEIDFGDDGDGQGGGGGLLLEVVHHQLFVGGVEAEPRRQLRLLRAGGGIGALH